MWQKFNYYGYDKEVYEACKEPIRESNRQHAEMINWWFLLVNILCFICAQFGWLNVDPINKWTYAGYIIATVVFMVLCRFVRIIHRIPLIPTLINITILVSYGIVMSNAAPYMIAFMYLIIMLVIAMSYIETMFRMICIQGICTAIFIYFSRTRKPLSVSYQDICNTIIILGLSLILHYRFQKARIHQFVINNQNIQIRREMEVESSFDSLTSLFNRRTFFSLCNKAIQEKQPYMVLCMIDLDDFKQINDNLGHQEGDRAIQITGEKIAGILHMDISAERWEYKENVIREEGSFAGRLGGDEFILLIRDKESERDVMEILKDLLNSLNNFDDGMLHGLQASIGMTQILPDENNIDNAYKRADDALYHSKRTGKNLISTAQGEGKG